MHVPAVLTADGKLLNPQKRWGGIMRGIDQIDFETGNVEFIEFWMQDPFIKNPASTGGKLYFNLGNISEDVLTDGKRFFENGISGAVTKALEDSSTRWGKVPANPIQVTQAFSNDPTDRPFRMLVLMAWMMKLNEENSRHYLDQLSNYLASTSPVYQTGTCRILPVMILKTTGMHAYDKSETDILDRYKNINSPQGNSPVAASGDQFVSAFTLYPDQEEFNRDNTLNELEEYFQYKVELKPQELCRWAKTLLPIVSQFTPSGGPAEKWYLFRIPIADYQKKIGNIPDFKSIRFIRMFLTGFPGFCGSAFCKTGTGTKPMEAVQL